MRKFSSLVAATLLAGVAVAQPTLNLKGFRSRLSSQGRNRSVGLKTRTPGRSHLLVQFGDAPDEDRLNELNKRGAAILSYVPDFALSISARDGMRFDGLNARWVGRLLPEEKISAELDGVVSASGTSASALIEFYPDVDKNDARAIAALEGVVLEEHPDLLAQHLLVRGSREQLLSLAEWDEVSYVFPASPELIRGTALRGCVGALTNRGMVGQAVALIGQGWDGPGQGAADLRYAFVHPTEKLPVDAQEAEIVRAFNEWAKYAKLTFSPASSFTDNQTIAVLFASGAHGDSYPFDGPGGVIAHTFYPLPSNPEPIAGDMHFDNDESWNIGADIDLFSLALHETGHALGLGHSDTPGDVMYPYYSRHTTLTQNDITAILQLYAPQDSGINPGSPPAANPLVLTVQTPPSTTTASSTPMAGTASGGAGSLQVSWSTSQGSAGMAQGSAQWTIAAVPLLVGLNVVNVQVTDSQQNRLSQNLVITRQQSLPSNPPPPPPGPDTTPPSIVIQFPANSNISTSATSLIFTGTASDDAGVSKVTWSSSTGSAGTATGTEHWSTPPIALYIGTTNVIVRAYDMAGNMSWRSVTVTRR